MSDRVFLSEYCGDAKSAWVCQRPDQEDFVVICYRNSEEQRDLEQSFGTEHEADDFAEDWVLQAE